MNIVEHKEHIQLRQPNAFDGHQLHRLIQSCPPLDENSVYCNLLQCSHFAATSVVGEADGELVCAISGYQVPERPDTLFIWQVAVAESARGQGVAGKMLAHILARPVCAEVRYLETTVTNSNKASWALFEGFARRFDARLSRSEMFEHQLHFAGAHETEVLARIGPLPANKASTSNTAATNTVMEKTA
ncbi:diaminobutyrate acetyltransferase [Seongchinamella sediminis]|uniref:L-2,4-diaminobutyric acid acetyltransferase n=1 Tax=Seongchinamella sediminis TaxID=2283635 RepID=A0A3L7DWY8_9GAMM|nr:diaminobutyrate acetyltransferase [Seongchinamella sediminis]RLQ22077.1 diaminobutyrate acetyltransferase [Seongchinamella sediminis]